MTVEWNNGDECVYKDFSAVIVGHHQTENTIIIDSCISGLEACDEGELSKPEAEKQEKEE